MWIVGLVVKTLRTKTTLSMRHQSRRQDGCRLTAGLLNTHLGSSNMAQIRGINEPSVYPFKKELDFLVYIETLGWMCVDGHECFLRKCIVQRGRMLCIQ